ncbi:hypothetical protein BB559_005708 [Furculomyces boomerangus]|uniref:Uncharacterized protein n=1 Tax=Furculomyces boomerangus TaxID=61424 RepID=A0A2T9Y713_9FUNG|nr:hypothetical protein BB559_005742 [Furculomyces boomerangus]PVU88140.1 hypothetical protein BB559_005708 [Furculomyces boomerangus]
MKIALGFIAISMFPMAYSTYHRISGVIIYNLLYQGKVHEDCIKDCVYEIKFENQKTFRFNSEGVYFGYLGRTLNLSYNLNESIRGQSDIKDCNYYVLQFETKFKVADE